MSGLTRNCPVRGCRETMPEGHVCCRRHWYHLPKIRREKIFALFRDAPGSKAHRHEVLEAVAWLNRREASADPPPEVREWIENTFRPKLREKAFLESHLVLLFAGYREEVVSGCQSKEAMMRSLKVTLAAAVLEAAGIPPAQEPQP